MSQHTDCCSEWIPSEATVASAFALMRLRALLVMLFGGLACCLSNQVIYGQSIELPRQEYYIARDLYDAGNISAATEGFRTAMNRGQLLNQQRWVDSIPALVMLGECYNQQGAIAQSLEQYDAAVMVALAFPTWVNTLRAAETQIDPPAELKAINWTKLTRRTQLVRVPRSMSIALDPASAKLAAAGSLAMRVDVSEVVRCLAIALHRRSQLLGPLARYSPLTAPSVQLFSQSPPISLPWVRSAWQTLHGFSVLAQGDEAQAKTLLTSGSTIDNQADYFLTPQCLLALAWMDVKQNNDTNALSRLGDASLRAAQLEQADTLAESLAMLGQVASASRRVDVLPVLQSAMTWSRGYSALPHLCSSGAVAELAAVAGNVPVHDAVVNEMLKILGGKDLVLPRVQAHLGYAMARSAALQNRLPLAEQQLDTAMLMLRGNAATGAATRRVFQTQLTLGLLSRGDLPVADGALVLDSLLGEPPQYEWRLWPLECLVSISTAHLDAYEKSLELAERRGNTEDVLKKMDMLQRERFYEVLPLGGRLLSLRRALHVERTELAPQTQVVVDSLLKAYPVASTLPVTLQAMVTGLTEEPMAVDDRGISNDTKKRFAEMGKLAAQQESLVMAIALHRGTVPRDVPAAIDLPDLRSSLGNNDVVLAFGNTPTGLVGAVLTRQAEYTWTVPESRAIDVKTALLLTQIGLSGAPNLDVASSTLPWRTTAADLASTLLPPEARQMIAAGQRIIIVPNGNLWYLPFELLPASAGDPRTTLLARHAVCYAPTLAHVPQLYAPAPAPIDTVGVFNNFFSSDRETNQHLAAQVGGLDKNCLTLDIQQKGSLASPSWLRIRADQMWVACELPMAKTPWELRILPLEPSQENALANWMQSPMKVPSRMFLPGLQSSAQRVEMNGGNELFVPACTLMSVGVRSVWMSRWKVGGRSTELALARVIEELEYESPSSAWQRAAIALWAEKLRSAEEPILPGAKSLPANIDGNHPLLWSGYLMLGDHPPPN